MFMFIAQVYCTTISISRRIIRFRCLLISTIIIVLLFFIGGGVSFKIIIFSSMVLSTFSFLLHIITIFHSFYFPLSLWRYSFLGYFTSKRAVLFKLVLLFTITIKTKKLPEKYHMVQII